MKNLKLEDGEVLVSFDVVSLYTNVPVKEAIKEAADRLYSGEFDLPPVDKDTFIQLLTLSSTNVVMSTHDGYYIQRDGLAMGSPPAPLLANIWLYNRETTIKDNAKLFERYMDDVIRSIKIEAVDAKLKEVNSIHPNLKFTVEMEEDSQIPFLDMLLIRNDKQVESTWYCKPTDTGLLMNFHALAPKRYKRGVVNGFVHRIYRACSTWVNFDSSLKRAKSLLERNQYPADFYEPIIEKVIEKLVKPNDEAEEKPEILYKVKIQYRGFHTDQFVKYLKESGAPVQVVLTIQKLKSCLPSLKQRVPMMLRSNLVYKFTCPRCNACYVGKTCRHLASRVSEYRTKSSEPVFRHMTACGVDKSTIEDNVEVLRVVGGNNSFHLSIMEALYIRELAPKINTRDEYRDYDLVIALC